MKSKLKLAVYGIAVIAALSSCNKEQPETLAPVSKSLPKAMTITAGTDAGENRRTSLNGTTVLWQQDALVVFDENFAGVKFTTEAKDVSAPY